MRVIRFVIDGVTYDVPEEVAAALSDRLDANSGGDLSSAAYTARAMIDRLLDENVAAAPEWHVPEKDALRRALEEWLQEEGAEGFPESLVEVRYALFGEWQDEAPGGLYLFMLETDSGVIEREREMERPPVPGQAASFDGRSYIVKNIRRGDGTGYVAIVRATIHRG